MASSRVRIPVPTVKDPVGVLDLAGLVLKKHQADGPESPIRGQLKADFDAVSDDIAQGLKDDAEAKELTRQLEAIYERRNNCVGRIQPLLPRISKALQSEYGTSNLRQMGHHGFTVNDSPQPAAKAAAKAKAADKAAAKAAAKTAAKG